MPANKANIRNGSPIANAPRSAPSHVPPEGIRIGGLVPFSTVDFPGRLSAVVFCQGCPWRCRYCHNPHLQPFSGPGPGWPEVLGFLATRQGFLDAVVFSGGEPTAQPQLRAAMQSVRNLGFRIGLHTAGIFPRRLRSALPLTDWVGLDIKAPFDGRYDTITQAAGTARLAKEALLAVRDSGVEYEIRTTWHPLLLDPPAKQDIERAIAECGARPTRWQTFRPDGCADPNLRNAD